jgi:NAD(P)-dependent dehydrogenase (short-subunit alcohol dehydrogenase family)
MTSSGAAVSGYQGWGMYGAAKAAINHLALTLATEEPDLTTVAIRPGVVDTEMQREIREVHHGSMSKKDSEKFLGLKQSGGLLKPEQPGHVMARLVLEAPSELNGRFLK